MTNSLVRKVARLGSAFIETHNDDSVVLRKEGLLLDVYDKGNLLGFKLTGTVDGKEIHLVHDTDNYARDNSAYKSLYEDAEEDALHITKQFLENKIETKSKVVKKLFGEKRIVTVTIPDKTGRVNEYKPLTVNTTNFFG